MNESEPVERQWGRVIARNPSHELIKLSPQLSICYKSRATPGTFGKLVRSIQSALSESQELLFSTAPPLLYKIYRGSALLKDTFAPK
jgi:hypothetical protein